MGGENSGRESLFETIKKAFLRKSYDADIYDIGLPASYIEVLERWIFIDQCRQKHYPRLLTEEIICLYVSKFNKSRSQFFLDKKNSESLFGKTATINKDYETKIAIHTYDMILNLALAQGDLKSAIEANKQKTILLGLMSKEEANDFDGNSLNKNFVLNTNIYLDGKKVAERKLDISNLQNIPYKELNEVRKIIDTPEVSPNEMEALLDDLETKEEDE